jgi:hypothetical protein
VQPPAAARCMLVCGLCHCLLLTDWHDRLCAAMALELIWDLRLLFTI